MVFRGPPQDIFVENSVLTSSHIESVYALVAKIGVDGINDSTLPASRFCNYQSSRAALATHLIALTTIRYEWVAKALATQSSGTYKYFCTPYIASLPPLTLACARAC